MGSVGQRGSRTECVGDKMVGVWGGGSVLQGELYLPHRACFLPRLSPPIWMGISWQTHTLDSFFCQNASSRQ